MKKAGKNAKLVPGPIPGKYSPHIRGEKEHAFNNKFMSGTIIIHHHLHTNKRKNSALSTLYVQGPVLVST